MHLGISRFNKQLKKKLKKSNKENNIKVLLLFTHKSFSHLR